MVNDVSGGTADADMLAVVADANAAFVAMHMRGNPRTMQRDPHYDDVVEEVKRFLAERLEFALGRGVPESRLILDPGIGFGKTIAHNLTLLRRLDELSTLGRPILVGTSRKSFIGRLTGRDTAGRLHGTIATNVIAYERGATIFRVHEVAPLIDALRLTAAVLDSAQNGS
jgi:dihydropteroate synthase